ncbi:MAG TPA: response regulator transcription factor [Clostridiales bacterium]|jgi:two-component system alkaline phosphatase synthesis response regulator PhoP|nr:response regulator transcription factor [Clostridiales bacterium]
MDKKLIFVVEDDENIRELIRCTLEAFSFACETFETAEELLARVEEVTPNLFLLDIMLPAMSGLDALHILKKNVKTQDIPAIMITAKSSEADKVSGLDAGADDFITKPFGVLELSARVRAVLRRMDKPGNNGILTYKDLSIDTNLYEVTKAGEKLKLTRKEYELLKFLCENVGKVMTREAIVNTVWGQDYSSTSRTLDMHLKTLRGKLNDDAESPKYIRVVRGVGYTMS